MYFLIANDISLILVLVFFLEIRGFILYNLGIGRGFFSLGFFWFVFIFEVFFGVKLGNIWTIYIGDKSIFFLFF